MPSQTFLLRDVQPVCDMISQQGQGHRRVIDGGDATVSTDVLNEGFSTVDDLDVSGVRSSGTQETTDASGKSGRRMFLVILHRLRSPTRS